MYAGPLEDIDWARIWDRQWRRLPAKGDGPEYWDRKAADLDSALQDNGDDDYVTALLQRMDLTPQSAVLDVGCGTGSLAIPLARRVRALTAVDLSPLMLKYLRRNASAAGVDNIVAIEKDWLDIEVGVDLAPHDIVIASRCLPLGNLRESLLQLNRAATRRCYLTWPAAGNQLEEEVASVLGTDYYPSPSYIIMLNLLFTLGIRAEVEMFEVPATRRFHDLGEAIYHLTRGVKGDSRTERRLQALVMSRLRQCDGLWCWDLVTRWALVSWRKDSQN